MLYSMLRFFCPSLSREQPDHLDLPPAQPVRAGGAVPAGRGEAVEVPGHGAGGLPQPQPLPQRGARRRRHAGHVLLHAGARGKRNTGSFSLSFS